MNRRAILEMALQVALTAAAAGLRQAASLIDGRAR